eukprot:contig_30118_g7376
MDATLTDGMAIRTLARVLVAAAKIGDNICVEPHTRSVRLRALASNKSSAVEFTLESSFFDSYLLLSPPMPPPVAGADVSPLGTPATPTATPQRPVAPSASLPQAVVVAAKLLLPIFRTPATIERLTLALPSDSPRLSIHIAGVAGVAKSFSLPAIVGDLLRPVVSRSDKACRLQCRSALLTTVLSNFHTRLEEVTLAASVGGLRLSSYLNEVGSAAPSPAPAGAPAVAGGGARRRRGSAAGAGGSGSAGGVGGATAGAALMLLRTELSAPAREFEAFVVPPGDGETVLTLPLKPFRTAVEWAEHFPDAPLGIFFDGPGVPVVMDVAAAGLGAGVLPAPTPIGADAAAPPPAVSGAQPGWELPSERIESSCGARGRLVGGISCGWLVGGPVSWRYCRRRRPAHPRCLRACGR